MEKITAEILAGKGVVGLADTPGLTKEEMQRKIDEIGKDVLVPAYNELVEELMGEGGAATIGYAPNELLPGAENLQQAVDQTVEKISDQEKDLKQYVDDTVKKVGAADMTASVYDPQHKERDIFAYAKETAKAEAENTIGKTLLLAYQKADTTHALSGLSGAAGTLSCVFTATADYTKGDTFTVDGESYTVKQQNGEEAGDKLFAAGAVVSCIIDTAGKTVNFKSGGGGKKEGMYAWKKVTVSNEPYHVVKTYSVPKEGKEFTSSLSKATVATEYSFNPDTGKLSLSGTTKSIYCYQADSHVGYYFVTSNNTIGKIKEEVYDEDLETYTWMIDEEIISKSGEHDVPIGYVVDNDSDKYPVNGVASDGFAYRSVRGMQYATGTGNAVNNILTVNGLLFKPVGAMAWETRYNDPRYASILVVDEHGDAWVTGKSDKSFPYEFNTENANKMLDDGFEMDMNPDVYSAPLTWYAWGF